MTHSPNTKYRWVLAIILLATISSVAFGEGSVPRLEADMETTLALDFTDTTVRAVYETLGETAGIQFVFHDEVDLEELVSLSLSDVSLREVLVLLTDKLGYLNAVRGPRTMFVAPNTRPMRQIYTPQGIQVFHLSHASPEVVITALRSML